MADEQDAGNSRPVDPPIIDIEAEEVGRSQEIPPEPAEEVSKVVPKGRRFAAAWLATALAGLALLIACASLAVIVGRANVTSVGDNLHRLQPQANRCRRELASSRVRLIC
jgi:hypothetical protein